MMQILFSFTFNTETKEATFAGNVDPIIALHALQDIAFSSLRTVAVDSAHKEHVDA